MAGQETINPRTIHHSSQRRLSVNSSPDAINLTPNDEPTLVYRPNSGIYWIVKHNGVVHNLKFQPGPIRDRKDYVNVSLEIQKDLLVKHNLTVNNDVIVNRKVGIGNSDPGSILDVRGGTGTGFTGAGQLTLSTAEATVVDNDILGVLAFQAPKETGADAILPSAAIWGESEATFDASNNDTALVFATANSETVLATAQERMRIDSSGNVGIGEIAPEGNLHISSLTDATFILEADTDNDTGTEAYNPKIELRQDGDAVNSFLGIVGADGSLYTGSIRNALYLESKNNNPAITNIQFVTGGDLDAEEIGLARMTVTATGQVGIGTNTPEGKLSVTSGYHVIAVEQDIEYAHSVDNTAIVELSDVKIPGKAIITRVVAVVKTLSNLSTHEVNIQMSTTSGVSADGVDSFTELLGAGVTNTDSTDSTSASDISMGTSASDLKDVWICRDVVRNGTSDQYVYVCNAGTGNGTTNSSAGTLVIIIEYYGMD